MTLQEYYGFPKNVPVSIKEPNYFDTLGDGVPLPTNLDSAYKSNTRMGICKLLDTSNVTSMYNTFNGCTGLSTIPPLDTSNVTNMNYMFQGCENLVVIPPLDTSNVTSMNSTFYGCKNLVTIPPLDTSNVVTMQSMLNGCENLVAIPPLDFSKINSDYNTRLLQTYSSTGYPLLTDIGGFINMKYSWNDTNGLPRCPYFTYESCINILNGLYDFTGNGQTPTSTQGKLKVHANFLTAVGDEISIGTNKGWTITA